MPSKKPVIATRIDAVVKEAFSRRANQEQVTEAKLLELIIRRFLGAENFNETAPKEKSTDDLEVRSKDIRVRVTPSTYQQLQYLGESRGWSRSTYIAKLLDVHLTGNPRFSDKEFRQLKMTTYQLSAVGRNINQIARALNSGIENDMNNWALDLQHVSSMINEVRSVLKDAIRANMNAWGVTNGQ